MKYILSLSALFLLSLSVSAQGYRTHHKNKKTENAGEKIKYGKNIISFSPIQIFMTDTDQENPDVAVNLAYERIFDNELVSFKLPVSLSLINNYMYIMPALKLYPTKQGIVKYSVGPQLLFGTGDGTYTRSYQDPNTGFTTIEKKTITRKQFGFLIDNTINFTIAKSLYVGLNASLGIVYYDNLPRSNNYYNLGITPFGNGDSQISPAFQLNFNMGYRF